MMSVIRRSIFDELQKAIHALDDCLLDITGSEKKRRNPKIKKPIDFVRNYREAFFSLLCFSKIGMLPTRLHPPQTSINPILIQQFFMSS
ncbi:hypothetical protein CEN46_15910 [Fischerella thermalis CCMEE 5318]|uniref:Uncharacterized protein n=1 Tax=Fischerella thermalis CCMEE 5318 TaxID=2019666 RepID=A0A2N6LCQ5_9CYAN|nr:hypothetical protein CEN46_15910 [Fischerella thermalis CCMEE 5318]